jgi:hypothetical protein
MDKFTLNLPTLRYHEFVVISVLLFQLPYKGRNIKTELKSSCTFLKWWGRTTVVSEHLKQRGHLGDIGIDSHRWRVMLRESDVD